MKRFSALSKCNGIKHGENLKCTLFLYLMSYIKKKMHIMHLYTICFPEIVALSFRSLADLHLIHRRLAALT